MTIGSYQYLKTLDEFIRLLPSNSPTKKIKERICNSSKNSSAFLDIVVEAAWALSFWQKGITVEREKSFGKRDADFMLTIDGVEYWLDAISVKLSDDKFYVSTPIATSDVSDTSVLLSIMNDNARIAQNKELVLATLVERAKTKYLEKFREGVLSGIFDSALIGILLCVLKSDMLVTPALNYGIPELPITAPEGLFDDGNLGLNLVWVHRLVPLENGVLCPDKLREWSRNL